MPGNHDYAILMGQSIWSEAMEAQGKTAEQLHKELLADRVALAYVRRLVDQQPPGKTGNGIRFLLDEKALGDG